MKILILTRSLISIFFMAGRAQTSNGHTVNTPKASGYAPVNG